MNEHESSAPSTGCASGCHCDSQDAPQATAIPRRFFLLGAMGVFTAIWGALAAYPLFRYMTTGQEEPAGSGVTRMSMGKATDFPNDSAKNFQFGRKPAILLRNPQGELSAFIAVCTHLGCTVQYAQPKQKIWCACHGGEYDMATGKNIAGPPPKPLTPLKVAIEKGEIIVSVA